MAEMQVMLTCNHTHWQAEQHDRDIDSPAQCRCTEPTLHMRYVSTALSRPPRTTWGSPASGRAWTRRGGLLGRWVSGCWQRAAPRWAHQQQGPRQQRAPAQRAQHAQRASCSGAGRETARTCTAQSGGHVDGRGSAAEQALAFQLFSNPLFSASYKLGAHMPMPCSDSFQTVIQQADSSPFCMQYQWPKVFNGVQFHWDRCA